jgi:hypothetical protein
MSARAAGETARVAWAPSLRVDPLTSPEVSVKLFVTDDSDVRLEELIPVFHRWIREDLLADELMIDVAGYGHVPKGPGIVLVCDKAHYSFDMRAGRAGIRYRGRREVRAAGPESIVRAFGSVLAAARLVESEPALGGRCRFRCDEFEFAIFDRLRAPSDPETFAAVRPALEAAVKTVFDAPPEGMELVSGPREPFLVSVRTGSRQRIEELLGRLRAGQA